jgi:ribonucleoside-triphosphate reductase
MISNTLPTDYQNFIALSRYARWKEDEQRRETWGETVTRYFDYMASHLRTNNGYKLPDTLRGELEEAVLNQSIMPSMRALMTAGPALDRCHVGGYNCSYVPVDSPRAFDESMYILCVALALASALSVIALRSYLWLAKSSTIQTQ